MTSAKLEATSVRNSLWLEIGKYVVTVLVGCFAGGWSARGTFAGLETRVSVTETRQDAADKRQDATDRSVDRIDQNVQRLVDVLVNQKK